MKTFEELFAIFNQLSLMAKLLEGEEKLNCVMEMIEILGMMRGCVKC